MSDEQTQPVEPKADAKKQKHRSPNYPYIGLEDALTRTRELIGVAGIAPIRITTAREVWDYQQGTGNQVVAALDAYGLIIVEGVAEARLLKITTEARKILDNTSDSPALLKAAALAPPIHQEIWQHYNGVLPPDNRVLREYLVYSKGFNPAYVEKFITQFRETLAFANVTASDKITDVKEAPPVVTGGQTMQTATQQTPIFTPPPPMGNTPPSPFEIPKASGDVLSFNLSRTGKAQVMFNGQVTQEAIRKLIALLDLSVDTYPTQAELEQPKQAMWRNKDHDLPVTVTGELGERDGKKYYAIAESETGIPEDELDFDGGGNGAGI